MTTTNVPVVKKFYNPLIVKLETLEIKDKTVDSYYTQIKNNYYLSKKAHYVIARDMFDASKTLSKEDFERLVKMLNFSKSKVSRYLSVGGDVRLWKLFIQGKLPMKWTNQYLLTTLTDKQFEKVQEKIDPDTTAREIYKLADKDPDPKIEEFLMSLGIQVDKREVKSPTVFNQMINSLKSSLTKFSFIKIKEKKLKEVEDKIKSLFKKQKEARENI